MSEVTRISEQLRRSFEGEAWHGSAVLELLDGVTAVQAARKLIPNAHSIWELVLHMTTWKEAVRRKLGGETVKVTPERDWPARGSSEPTAWDEAVAELKEAHAALSAAVASLDDRMLDEIPAGERLNRYVLIHGVIQHDLYHAGQIGLLKKG